MIGFFQKIVIPLCLIMVIMVTVVFLFGKIKQHRNIVDADFARKSGEPIPVSVYKADIAPLRPVLVGSCMTSTSRVVEIGTAMPDLEVKEVYTQPGETVEKGQLLFKLDQREELYNIGQIQQRIKWLGKEVEARADLVEFHRNNRKQGHSLETDYRRAQIDLIVTERSLAEAKGELEISRVNLNKTLVQSPVNGVVDDIIIPLEIPISNTPLAKIRVIDPMLTSCEFDVSDYSYLRAAKDDGVVVLNGLDGYKLEAKYLRDISDQNENGNLKWDFSLRNEDAMIQAGMEGHIRFFFDDEVLRIPSVALINRDGNKGQVFSLTEDNTVSLVSVVTGQQAGGYVEVISGIEQNTAVVVGGQLDLIDNDEVRVLDPRSVTYPYE